MLARSAQAPPSWGQENTELAFREQALATGPDLVLLQELPRMVPFVETHDMIKANPESHQGNLAILISHRMLADETATRPDGPQVTVIPGCAILITLADGLTVANVHLAPGPGAAGERLEQLAQVVEASPTPDLVIIGDTNTRQAEVATVAEAGLAGPRPPRPTWDSRRNRFNAGGPEFTAYFTRWFATEAVLVDDVDVLRDPIDLDGQRFHLSDHYPLTGRVTLS